jgi:hypothetical protein
VFIVDPELCHHQVGLDKRSKKKKNKQTVSMTSDLQLIITSILKTDQF